MEGAIKYLTEQVSRYGDHLDRLNNVTRQPQPGKEQCNTQLAPCLNIREAISEAASRIEEYNAMFTNLTDSLRDELGDEKILK